MPTFFRPSKRVSFFRRRHRALPPGKLNPSSLAPSGTSSALFVGTAIRPGVLASAGVAAFAAVGRIIRPGVLASAGVGQASVAGTHVIGAALSSVGLTSVNWVKPVDLITSRRILQDPVDAVMAGNQREFKNGRTPYQALKGIFNE